MLYLMSILLLKEKSISLIQTNNKTKNFSYGGNLLCQVNLKSPKYYFYSNWTLDSRK